MRTFRSLIPVWMDSWSDGPGSNSHFFDIWRITAALKPLKQQVIGSIGNVLWLVMGTIGMVMLIVCTNVANLLLVRADSRQQGTGSAGRAGRRPWPHRSRTIFESLVLGRIGGAAGIAVAYGATATALGHRTCKPASAERDFAEPRVLVFHCRAVRSFPGYSSDRSYHSNTRRSAQALLCLALAAQ